VVPGPCRHAPTLPFFHGGSRGKQDPTSMGRRGWRREVREGVGCCARFRRPTLERAARGATRHRAGGRRTRTRRAHMPTDDDAERGGAETSLAEAFTLEHRQIDAGIEQYLATEEAASPGGSAAPLLSAMEA